MLALLVALADAALVAQADPAPAQAVQSALSQPLLRTLLPLLPADALQVLRGGPPRPGALPAATSQARAGRVAMQQPKQNFDNDMSGWKPPSGGGDAHGGEGFASTDTPDFLPEEGSEAWRQSQGISFTDGMQGSQADPNRKKSTGPELAGALDSNPDIYVPEVEDLDATRAGVEFVLPSSGMTNMDFEMRCDSGGKCKDLTIDVLPVAMTFEEFYAGFTGDSHPAFSVSPASGRMERRKGPPTQITVHCNPPGGGQEIVGYLCFILPEEKAFSTYYKITCTG